MKRLLQFVDITNESDARMREVTEAYFDGYPVGDRLLENVFFRVTVVKGRVVVEPRPEDAQYLAQFKLKRWIAEIKERVAEPDEFLYKTPDARTADVILHDDADPEASEVTIVA